MRDASQVTTAEMLLMIVCSFNICDLISTSKIVRRPALEKRRWKIRAHYEGIAFAAAHLTLGNICKWGWLTRGTDRPNRARLLNAPVQPQLIDAINLDNFNQLVLWNMIIKCDVPAQRLSLRCSANINSAKVRSMRACKKWMIASRGF